MFHNMIILYVILMHQSRRWLWSMVVRGSVDQHSLWKCEKTHHLQSLRKCFWWKLWKCFGGVGGGWLQNMNERETEPCGQGWEERGWDFKYMVWFRFCISFDFFDLMITLCSRLGREGVKGERKGTEASGKEQLDHSENDASDLEQKVRDCPNYIYKGKKASGNTHTLKTDSILKSHFQKIPENTLS